MTQAHHNTLWASWLVQALAHAGVHEAVISPGSRSAPLALAFAACERVRTHVVLDERAAAFVALGLARASRAPVALLCTSGSAAAHYLPAVMEAHHSRVPLLVLTADRPPELHDVGAPQTVDQAKLFGSYARAYIDVGTPCAEAPPRFLLGLAARAVAAACGSPAGPVHLNCPFREPLWDPQAPPPTPVPWSARALRGDLLPTPPMLDAFFAWARGLSRGVIVVGPRWSPDAAQEDRLAQALATLSDLLQWPVLVEPASQLRLTKLGDNFIASADALLKSPDLAQALAPDGALCLGQTPTSKALLQWLAAHAAGRVALVDPDGIWHDPSHCACLMLQAEPAALCEALVEALGQEDGGQEGWMWGTASPTPPVSWASRPMMWLERWRRAERAAQEALGGAWFEEALWEGAIARELWGALPEGASLHVASSMPIRDLDAFAPKRGPLRVLVSRGTNGIDGTLATAAGEALAAPDRAATVLLGDLAFLHDAGGLLAAPQLGANLRALVINNGGGGIFGFLPIAAHPSAFERFFLTPQDADLAALCAAAKAQHLRLTSIADLRAALQAPWRGVQVLELVVDRALNRALHQRAWAHVAASVRCALDLPTPASLP